MAQQLLEGRRASTRLYPIVARCLAGIFALAAIIVSITAWTGYRNALGSTDWPTTEGIVIESRIVGVGGGRPDSGLRTRVRYLYAVNGVKHEGWRITYQRKRGDLSADHAQNVLERYPSDEKIKVHYHPDRPGISVLEPGPGSFPVRRVALVLVLMAGAALVWRYPYPG